MNHSAQRKMLRVVGIIMVVLLPVMLSLWFAHIRAVKETGIHLRSFAQLALDKTERVIGQVDLARSAAEKYQVKFVPLSIVTTCSISFAVACMLPI
jgi:sensor c-di-GMP phosphodiesterase-like protein